MSCGSKNALSLVSIPLKRGSVSGDKRSLFRRGLEPGDKAPWDLWIQVDHQILARRPDQEMIDKDKEILLYIGLRFLSGPQSKNQSKWKEISTWLVGWVVLHINLCRLFNAKSIFMQIVLFQTIHFFQTVLIQLIQFSISTDFLYTFKYHNSSTYKNSV